MRTVVQWGYETQGKERELRAAVVLLVVLLVLLVVGSFKGCKDCGGSKADAE